MNYVTLVNNDIWVVFVHYYLRTVIFKLSILFKVNSIWPHLNNKASWLYYEMYGHTWMSTKMRSASRLHNMDWGSRWIGDFHCKLLALFSFFRAISLQTYKQTRAATTNTYTLQNPYLITMTLTVVVGSSGSGKQLRHILLRCIPTASLRSSGSLWFISSSFERTTR